MAYSSPEIIAIMNKVKAPYNINQLTSQLGNQAFSDEGLAQMKSNVDGLIQQRERIRTELESVPQVDHIFPSDSNFLLVRFKSNVDAFKLYKTMASNGVVVRYRGGELHCQNCLRITVGTPSENDELLRQIRELVVTFSS